jgi:hypothetical protein
MYYVLVLSAGMFFTAWMIWLRIDRPRKQTSLSAIFEKRKDD